MEFGWPNRKLPKHQSREKEHEYVRIRTQFNPRATTHVANLSKYSQREPFWKLETKNSSLILFTEKNWNQDI